LLLDVIKIDIGIVPDRPGLVFQLIDRDFLPAGDNGGCAALPKVEATQGAEVAYGHIVRINQAIQDSKSGIGFAGAGRNGERLVDTFFGILERENGYGSGADLDGMAAIVVEPIFDAGRDM